MPSFNKDLTYEKEDLHKEGRGGVVPPSISLIFVSQLCYMLSSQKTVSFLTEFSVKYIDKASKPSMAKQLFERFDGNDITDSMLNEATRLFNDNYGKWGIDPTVSRQTPKQGKLRKCHSIHVSNY